MKILIRPTKYTDIPGMIKVNIESLPENYDKLFWDQQFHIGKEHSFVAVFGSEVVGYVFCNKDSIISFAVQEKYRKKGLGRALLQHCVSTFSTPVNLSVRVNNTNAIKLYESFGFKIEKTIPNYYYNPVEDGHSMIRLPMNTLLQLVKKINVIL